MTRCRKILIPAFCLVILHPSIRPTSFPRVAYADVFVPFSSATPRRAIQDPRYRNNRCFRIELAHLPNTTAMRALVTVAPVFQDAGNVHAAPARRSATSIDTTDWRGCGDYDASYSTCHNSFVLQTLMRCLTKYSVAIHAHSTGTGVPAGAVLRDIRPVFRLYPIHRRNRSHDLC